AAGPHEQAQELAQLELVRHAEAEGVADGDLAREPERARALHDEPELPQAECTAVVQMNVHAHAVALRDPEDDVEVRDRIAIETGGDEAADEIRPPPHGGDEGH